MIRKRNEDFYRILAGKVGVPQIFIIADGMGGHSGGAVASQKAVNIIERALNNKKVWKDNESNALDIIIDAMQKANTGLFALANKEEELEGMGTTMIVSVFLNDKVYIGHVGDSRFYRIRDSIIEQVTLDHSLVEALISGGEITRNEAQNYPGKNIITRAIGAFEDLQVDTYFFDIEENDIFIMCTDGLTNKLKDDEILKVISENDDLSEACKILTQEANERGGDDNITIILIKNEL
jgi:protein phosphatase